MTDNIFFWEKTVKFSKDEDDCAFYRIKEKREIREIIRNLENKILGKVRNFSEITPENPSIKTWIINLIDAYPKRSDSLADDLINLYRAKLKTKSREEKFIIGLLQLRDLVVLIHSKKDLSLAQVEDRIEVVRTVLSTKNILRADIVKKDRGNITLSAFASSRSWSKGHASLWGIDPEDIGWDSLGEITAIIQVESFPPPLQMSREAEELQEMINTGDISATGDISVGRIEGKITKVLVYRKEMDFPTFYEWFITQTEKLESYRKKFKEIIEPQKQLLEEWSDQTKYRYEEDESSLYEITTQQSMSIQTKEHPRYVICFFTKEFPGIMPKHTLLWKLYQAVFENRALEIWHAGEASVQEPVSFGNLSVFNKLLIPAGLSIFSNTMLNQIQDINGNKARRLLQYAFCEIHGRNLAQGHFRYLFDFLKDKIIRKELYREFKDPGLFAKEELIEFKSADDVDSKPSRFARNTLAPEIKGYIQNGTISRYCILYGIEDTATIRPIMHLHSDRISTIEQIVNEELKDSKVRASIEAIPHAGGRILSVFLTPLF